MAAGEASWMGALSRSLNPPLVSLQGLTVADESA